MRRHKDSFLKEQNAVHQPIMAKLFMMLEDDRDALISTKRIRLPFYWHNEFNSFLIQALTYMVAASKTGEERYTTANAETLVSLFYPIDTEMQWDGENGAEYSSLFPDTPLGTKKTVDLLLELSRNKQGFEENSKDLEFFSKRSFISISKALNADTEIASLSPSLLISLYGDNDDQ